MTKEAANPGFYDADSSTYDEQRWTTAAGARTNRIQQRIMLDLCGDWRGGRVLEVGPGTARFTIPLASRGNRLTLLDVSRGMLEEARANLEREGLLDSVDDFVNGSIYELPFEDGAFDHAISLNVLNHLERAGDAIAELARVTRPGSTLLFNYANLRSWYWPAARRINRRHTAVGQEVYSTWERPGDVGRMIRSAGLRLVRRRGMAHVPRALERFRLGPVIGLVDTTSRAGPLQALAPVHFCLCEKRDVETSKRRNVETGGGET